MEIVRAYDACDHRSLLSAELVLATGALEIVAPEIAFLGVVALPPMLVVAALAMAFPGMVASARGVPATNILEKDVVGHPCYSVDLFVLRAEGGFHADAQAPASQLLAQL